MRIRPTFFILFYLLCTFCSKKEIEPVSFEKDQIYLYQIKEIKELESDYDKIKKSVEDARERIKDTDIPPKIVNLVKAELFTQEKYMRLIEQKIALNKIEINDRKKHYIEVTNLIPEKELQIEYEEYLLSKKTNPPIYVWRDRPGISLPAKDIAAGKKADEAKAGKHGEVKKEEATPSHH